MVPRPCDYVALAWGQPLSCEGVEARLEAWGNEETGLALSMVPFDYVEIALLQALEHHEENVQVLVHCAASDLALEHREVNGLALDHHVVAVSYALRTHVEPYEVRVHRLEACVGRMMAFGVHLASSSLHVPGLVLELALLWVHCSYNHPFQGWVIHTQAHCVESFLDALAALVIDLVSLGPWDQLVACQSSLDLPS